MAKKKAARFIRGMFGRKAGGMWFSGLVSREAAAAFRKTKAELETLYTDVTGRKMKASKADVIEYLCLGEDAARAKIAGW